MDITKLRYRDSAALAPDFTRYKARDYSPSKCTASHLNSIDTNKVADSYFLINNHTPLKNVDMRIKLGRDEDPSGIYKKLDHKQAMHRHYRAFSDIIEKTAQS